MKKRILIAPLNWGLGHASRCIPVIRELQRAGFIPVIASDGMSLLLLQKEFPELQSVALASYQIRYPGESENFKFRMIRNVPNMLKAINTEKKQTEEIIKKFSIDGIISDNRFGVYHKEIPSVIITHQINVLTGSTSWLTSNANQILLKKFQECWVPDFEQTPNFSGRMGHSFHLNFPVRYIGILSRMQKRELPEKYDITVILSGPEPQRSILEKKLFNELKAYAGTILFIRGKVEPEQQIKHSGNIYTYNFMTSSQLEKALNESKMVVSRSGYSTVMDLASLRKKVFFIPTPGQYEQEYLASRLEKLGIAPYCHQDEFGVSELSKMSHYVGFQDFNSASELKDLFSLFESK